MAAGSSEGSSRPAVVVPTDGQVPYPVEWDNPVVEPSGNNKFPWSDAKREQHIEINGPEAVFAVDISDDELQLPPADDDEGPMNGSCMPGPGRSRSPPRRAQQPLPLAVPDVLSSLAVRDVLPSQTQIFPQQAGFIPKYAVNAVSNLPCEISCRFPVDCDEEMEFDAKMRHCREMIWKFLLPNPQISKWYIGITASPDWRWGRLGHCLEYDCMVLVLVARTSADIHRIEEALVREFAGWRGLQNIKAEAKGSLRGCPFFMYFCFGTGLLRRGGGRN